MAWQPEDLTTQIDGVEDTFTTSLERVLGQVTVFHNLSRLSGSLYAEVNSRQIQLAFIPLIGDTLYIQYQTDATFGGGRVIASGCAIPSGSGPTPEGLQDILDGLDNRIDYLEQEEFFTRDPKNGVRAASTADVGAIYNPTGGLLGTGSLSGAPTSLDGVALVDDDRVLLKDQADTRENGIWRVIDATGGDWVRAPDFDQDHKVTQGARTAVAEGSVNKETSWLVIDEDPLTIGTAGGSAINWRQLSTGAGGVLRVEEQDGSPSIFPTTKIVVPNDTLMTGGLGEAALDFNAFALREVVLTFSALVAAGTAINVQTGAYAGAGSPATIKGDVDVTLPAVGAAFAGDARIEIKLNGQELDKGDGTGNGIAEWVSSTQLKINLKIKPSGMVLVRAPFPTA